jgi:hypothetical protein
MASIFSLQKITLVKLYVQLYVYSFFILCFEFHVACMPTKFCRICLHHIEGPGSWVRRSASADRGQLKYREHAWVHPFKPTIPL